MCLYLCVFKTRLFHVIAMIIFIRENMRMCVNERERRVSDEREREKEVYFVKRGSPTQLIAASARRDIVINKYRIKRMNPIDTLRQGR